MSTTNLSETTKDAAALALQAAFQIREITDPAEELVVGAYVKVVLTSGERLSGRICGVCKETGDLRIREGAGFSDVVRQEVKNLRVDQTRGLKKNYTLTPGKPNQKHRMLSRYNEI